MKHLKALLNIIMIEIFQMKEYMSGLLDKNIKEDLEKINLIQKKLNYIIKMNGDIQVDLNLENYKDMVNMKMKWEK